MHLNRIAALLGALLVFALGAAIAQTQSLDDQLKAANLAPTGVLRVAFLGTNPIQARINAETGQVTGPVADIVNELASRIGASVEFLPQSGAANVMSAVNSGAADLGFLAYEEARAEQVDFAGPYATMMNSFLVAADSPFQNSADVDAQGNVIGAVISRSQQVFLSANIQKAELALWEQQPPDDEIERLLVSGEISAVGQNRQRSVDHAAKFASLRVIDDNFMTVAQAFVMRPNETAKADALNRLMDELRGNGFVQASLEEADLLGGASVAQPGIP